MLLVYLVAGVSGIRLEPAKPPHDMALRAELLLSKALHIASVLS